MIQLKSTTLKGRFIEYSKHVLRSGFLLTDDNTESLRQIFDVFENKEYGVMIYGNPGVGKTMIFDMINKIINPKDPRRFKKLSALNVVLDFNANGHRIFRVNQEETIFYDDLGTEDQGRFFGEKVEVFEKLIQFRYELFRSKKIKTFFTTNLSPEEIKQRYGHRCFSRLKEMCEHVHINDKDKRSMRNFIGYPPVFYEVMKSDEDIYWENVYAELKEKAKNAPPVIPVKEGLGTRLKKAWGLGASDEQPKVEAAK